MSNYRQGRRNNRSNYRGGGKRGGGGGRPARDASWAPQQPTRDLKFKVPGGAYKGLQYIISGGAGVTELKALEIARKCGINTRGNAYSGVSQDTLRKYKISSQKYDNADIYQLNIEESQAVIILKTVAKPHGGISKTISYCDSRDWQTYATEVTKSFEMHNHRHLFVASTDVDIDTQVKNLQRFILDNHIKVAYVTGLSSAAEAEQLLQPVFSHCSMKARPEVPKTVKNPLKDHHPSRQLVKHSRKQQFDVYIGRPSFWGNPFKVGKDKDGDRHEVTTKYDEWLCAQPDLCARARRELKGKRIACWCHPLKCHGEVLARVANTEGDPKMPADRSWL
mmetsp:Transcript_17335/g.19317  ORF Transcript_17335/g.19317 Transcript_17335/m.19317 type:complete len:336 (+) Transcript_17335:11-1018(+)